MIRRPPAPTHGQCRRSFPLGLLLPALGLLAWEGAVRAGWIGANVLPPPSVLVGTACDLTLSGVLPAHMLTSTLRVLAGFLIGAALAMVAGAGVGLSPLIEHLLDPTVQALRAIPSLAWVPLLLLWLGIDETPKITLIALGAFFPVYLNFVSGIRNVDRKLVEVGDIHGLTGVARVWRIFLPAAAPQLFSGLRGGLSLAWMFMVAAELIAATRGLGYLLTDGRETGRADLMLVAILALALLGKLSDSVLRRVEQHLLGWRDVHETRAG